MYNVRSLCILLCVVLITNCTSKKTFPQTTVSLSSLKSATLDTGKAFTLLSILKTYPAKMDCDAKEKYTNLYVCKKWSNGDTIYVFEDCAKVSQYALTDTSS